MKTVILATTLALAIVAAQQSGSKKPKLDVGAGKVAWFDLTTTNLATSKAFYGKLFDWKFAPTPGAEAVAAEISMGDTAIGTLRVAEGKISSFNGVVYVQVDDMKAMCKKAQELGGTIPPGFPFDLDDGRGAIALVSDPAGHPVGMYSRTALAAKPAGK